MKPGPWAAIRSVAMTRMEKAKQIADETDLSLAEAMQVLIVGDGDENVVECVKEVLADTFTAYYRAHSAHWNVKGPAFGPYHDFFGLIAADLYAALDPLAEQVLMMGGEAPSNIPALLAHAKITPAVDSGNDPRSLCLDLLEMNEMLLDCLNEAFETATEANEQGLADLLAARIDASKKWSWQLSKSIEGA